MDATTLALLDAAAAGDFERVRQLAQVGADLNTLDDGETLLDRAVAVLTLPHPVPAFAADMLRLLLQLGADPNRPGHEGMTALHTAMLARNVELMRILLESGDLITCSCCGSSARGRL